MKIAAVERYRRLCQKNESENYLLDKYIFRKIPSILRSLRSLGLTANQATFLACWPPWAAFYFLMLNTASGSACCSGPDLPYYILDHVDGELARYYIATGRQTLRCRATIFDLLVHRYSSNLMVFMGIAVYRLFGYEFVILLGFAAHRDQLLPNVSLPMCWREGWLHDPGSSKARRRRILQQLERKQEQIEEVQGAAGKKILGELLFSPDILLRSSPCSSPILFIPQGLVLCAPPESCGCCFWRGWPCFLF